MARANRVAAHNVGRAGGAITPQTEIAFRVLMSGFYQTLGCQRLNGRMKHDRDSFRLLPPLTPLQQHPQFAAALAGMGRPMKKITLPHGGSAQVMERRFWPVHWPLRLVSRGPIWEGPATAAQMLDGVTTLRRRGVQIINNENVPGDVMKAAGYRQIMTPATIAVLDLRGTYADWLAAMTAKWRNALRRAEYAGLTVDVAPFSRADHKWILEADEDQQSTRGYQALPGALTQSYAVMNRDVTFVVTASDGATPVAAMIFLRHGTAATYQIGWTSVIGRSLRAHNLCLSTGMDILAEAGVTAIDLGVIDTENNPGLARFKLGSGAKPVVLGGSWIALPWLRPKPLA